MLACFEETAVANLHDVGSLIVGYAKSVNQSPFQRFVGNSENLYRLGSRLYCGQNVLAVVAHEQEHRVVWRFLEDFQYFVGALGVHLFGQPDYHYLVVGFVGLEADLFDDFCRFGSVYLALLVFALQVVGPVAVRKIGAFVHHWPPKVDVGVAHGLVLRI